MHVVIYLLPAQSEPMSKRYFVTDKPYPNDLDIVFFIPESYKSQHFRNLVLSSQSVRLSDAFWIGLPEQSDSLAPVINELEREFQWLSVQVRSVETVSA